MKKVNAVYIDYNNAKQVAWWNGVGRWLVTGHGIDTVVETATNKPVGVIVGVTGLLAKFVIDKINSFHGKDLKTMVYEHHY